MMGSELLSLHMPLCGLSDPNESWEDGQKNNLSPSARLIVRAHYKCPCDKATKEERPGIPPTDASFDVPLSKLPGKWLPKAGADRREEVQDKVIQSVCGVKPKTCPYQALLSPMVREIYRWRLRKEMNPALFNQDLPHWLFEGLEAYEAAYNRCMNLYFRKENEKRKEQIKPGKPAMPNVSRRK